jgi:DNA-binding MarR family transcriptional regulator
LALFVTMRQQSVDLRTIAGQAGVQAGYVDRALSELVAENLLLWLIQVGLLRREVDGQGLTNSFRLTPLGHQLVERWQQQSDRLPAPTWLDRLYNSLSRWLRLPSWLQPF